MASRKLYQTKRMTPVFSSSNHDAEMEAMAIKGVLDSSGIPAMIVGPHVLPNSRIPGAGAGSTSWPRRGRLIREARQGGRRAAEEAESATE